MNNLYKASILVLATAGVLINVAIPQEPATAPGKPAARVTTVLGPEQSRFAHLVTGYEMMRLHVKKMAPPDVARSGKNAANTPVSEDRGADSAFLDSVSASILDEASIGASWKVRWIPNEGPGATDFEKRAGKKLDREVSEVGEWSSPDTLLYIRSLHAREECVTCHSPPAPAKQLKAGDAMGRISLEITFRNKDEEAKKKR